MGRRGNGGGGNKKKGIDRGLFLLTLFESHLLDAKGLLVDAKERDLCMCFMEWLHILQPTEADGLCVRSINPDGTYFKIVNF